MQIDYKKKTQKKNNLENRIGRIKSRHNRETKHKALFKFLTGKRRVI